MLRAISHLAPLQQFVNKASKPSLLNRFPNFGQGLSGSGILLLQGKQFTTKPTITCLDNKQQIDSHLKNEINKTLKNLLKDMNLKSVDELTSSKMKDVYETSKPVTLVNCKENFLHTI